MSELDRFNLETRLNEVNEKYWDAVYEMGRAAVERAELMNKLKELSNELN